MKKINNTNRDFDDMINVCKDIYCKKMKDYGSSWRIMRPTSVTDQIFIKASRIRGIETNAEHKVDEGILPELIGIVNYSIIGLIQLEIGYSDTDDMTYERGVELYTKYIQKSKELMMMKNHDYGEAWRAMRMESYTDLILMKIYRTKQIENNNGKTIISEGIDANYFDMLNYAMFGLIKICDVVHLDN